MPAWLDAALDYIPRWLEFQVRLHEQPGCVIAIAYRGELVHEQAFGPLTPRHRFRVASHSKSFTAAGIMKLVERGQLRIKDPVGRHVRGLHRALAGATLAELLSHRAGVVRDGPDAGQFVDRRPFRGRCHAVRAACAAAAVIVNGSQARTIALDSAGRVLVTSS